MPEFLPAEALDQLFEKARTHYDWEPAPLDEALLRRLYDLTKMGPTSANASPARFIFCTSAEARDKLASLASDANAPKIRSAPVTVIIGMDLAFHDKLPQLFPHTDAKSWFEGNDALIRETAFRNSSLQGAWLIMAARALGLDTGPMSGFDKAGVDRAFWEGTQVETNFICSIGHGTGQKLFPRLPRLAFEDACRIA
ncbi:malonic semialdehyde reductase [Sandaracinobacter sp. RS1-74]|uniref:malonic semialdehyde reductase n=1 Tax=Sandaracinobacteroides sayramensis TaxID=2913411 RepID=UPI001ED9FC51|nr:malonic semialdehyde reductase [Sandaracinobacteroides sayramensis]MCG2840112.1 malonic semialdehyde reductase [Sandaracinobacteroides sayramensis]